MALGKKSSSKRTDLDFAFFSVLYNFYRENRKRIRQHYKELTKKFLDYNDPENNTSFLRVPQFEALEMYIFLKEFIDNKHVHEVFDDWYHKVDQFAGRSENSSNSGIRQLSFMQSLDLQDEEQYQSLFKGMKRFARTYPNYIFALTMGTGKTILMATCIYYEFILANKFPKDKRFCHNALVFAPDKTVLQSLREIQTFDMTKVVPPEYASFLQAHIQFHFLEDTGVTLNTMDKSMFNIVISNTQKIILKKQHKKARAADMFFSIANTLGSGSTVYDEYADLYDFDSPENELELTLNQRFHKLTRLGQLGIYVDEAHHAFGTQLAKDLGVEKSATSLRLTIDELAINLKRAGTQVVACYNYTGTPYVGKVILPEVVYAYGLKEAIDNKYLKQIEINEYKNTKTKEYLKEIVADFWKKEGEKRREGMLPKLAIFASTIEELQEELRPALEDVLSDLGISTAKILVNVGDSSITTNDDIREFNRLDTVDSDKQFILLVNKGREGWNCRSLFGVGLYRKPKSKIFVLQATMRCLRSIGDIQETGHIYLSEENMQILEEELQQNFRVSSEDIKKKESDKQVYEVRLVPPPVILKLKRKKRLYKVTKKLIRDGIDFEIDSINLEKYKITKIQYKGLQSSNKGVESDITNLREQRLFSQYSIVSEISRYLGNENLTCENIQRILDKSIQGMDLVCKTVNEHNEILYDYIIPRLFSEGCDIESFENETEEEIELIKEPKDGCYRVSAKPSLVSLLTDFKDKKGTKSFHLDTYCFDSSSEHTFFQDLISSDKIEKVYFTGMLTHGQSEFFIQYIDPESHAIRSYYPDFLVQRKDGTWAICEVKADGMIDDSIVQAKAEYAQQIASANFFSYHIIPSTLAGSHKGLSYVLNRY